MIAQTILETLRMPRYAGIGGVVASFFALMFVYITQADNLRPITSSTVYGLWDKVTFAFPTMMTLFFAQHTVWQIAVLSIIVILMGINIALLARDIHLRLYHGAVDGAMGIVGMITAAFGIGCSACGSALLSTIVGLSTTTLIIASLPFHGNEFMIIGLVLLVTSIYLLARKLRTPMVCASK